MPAICLSYEVHEPYRLRHYTVFDLGQNSIYEDDDHNCDSLLYTARACYLPMNDVMLGIIKRLGNKFKFSLSMSNIALEQFERYAPEVIDSFRALADTGSVEFIAETAPHSLAFLYSRDEFEIQVKENSERIKYLFGQKTVTFRNTELVYNNDLASVLEKMGFVAVLAEGADHVLGWRSPNYLYRPVGVDNLRLLLRNSSLSADIAARFSNRGWGEWPLTAHKYASWCHNLAGESELINIFNDYHTFGLRNSRESGIFEFMNALPEAILANGDFYFATPAEVASELNSVGEVDVPQFMSWDDEGCDLNAWLGNDMQKDAIHALYALSSRVRRTENTELHRDFERLQTSDHFHYMSTKWFSAFLADRPNPYQSPYDAYINYMNVLADLDTRLAEEERKISAMGKKASASDKK